MANSIDVESILNEVVEVNEGHNNKDVNICSETLVKMGYEVTGDNLGSADLTVSREGKSYTLFVLADKENDSYFGVPVGSIKHKVDIFKITADCIAFHYGEYIYQFKTKDLREALHASVIKLKNENRIAYSTRATAIKMKRLHAIYNHDCDGYDIMLYLPIKSLCEKIEHTKQKAV